MNERTPVQKRSDDAVALSDLLRSTGACQAEMAERCGRSGTAVQKWHDRRVPNSPSAHDVRRMPVEVARPVLEWIASSHGLTVVEQVAPGATVTNHLATLHRILKEGADVSTEYASAIADGVIDPGERMRLISELREDLAAKRALLKHLEEDVNPCGVILVRGGA